jgi:Domain of unknown function (DUF5916)
VYVGIRAFETQPEQIRAPLMRHDQINRTQDFVVVYLDPIGSRRSAQFFRVNAAGSMADGIHTAADDNEDFAPDFDWDAATARTPEGWTAVLRLPFASLRFADGEQNLWRIMVGRRLPREKFHLVTSVLVPRESASFIDNLQPLNGIRLPTAHNFLTLRPSVTAHAAREQAVDGTVKHQRGTDASLDVKWRPRAELVVDATLKPDFSQLALDVPPLAGNTRFALSIAEKRPFFFESSDLLRTPTSAFYTRSFTEPRSGLRATWRGLQWAGTTFAVDDRGGGAVLLPRPYGTDAAAQPASRTLAARGRNDQGNWQLGGVLAARQYEGDGGENTVLGPDGQWALGEHWRLRAQWLYSRTTAHKGPGGALQRTAATDGDQLYLRLLRNTDSSEGSYTLEDTSAGFRNDSGFVPQAGVRKFALFEGVSLLRHQGPFHELWANIHVERVEDKRTGQVVEQQVYPGLWSTGANNLEWWVEWHGLSQLRATAEGPQLKQNFLAAGLVITPARWFPLLDTNLSVGQLADTQAQKVRPGLRWSVSARLRPLPLLELEPNYSASFLREGSRRMYEESVANLLAIWHLDARSHVRAIVQRRALERQGELGVEADRSSTRVASLSWSRRWSAGTVLYVGGTRRERQSTTGVFKGTEAFVKLQFDGEEVRAALRPGG